MNEYKLDLIELASKFAPLANTFKDGICNDRVTQTITFTVPDILRFHAAVEQAVLVLIGKPVPNKYFDTIDNLNKE